MFISEFWCGVIATLGVELGAVIVSVAIDEIKKNKKKDKKDE